jgi:carboxyl-terminal processing protease
MPVNGAEFDNTAFLPEYILPDFNELKRADAQTGFNPADKKADLLRIVIVLSRWCMHYNDELIHRDSSTSAGSAGRRYVRTSGTGSVSFVRPLMLLWIITAAILCATQSRALQSAPTQVAANQISTENSEFGRVCQYVYKGEFDNAAELIAKKGIDDNKDLAEVSAITREYEQIDKQRAEAKKESYEKKWKKLQALKWGDSNDVNDVNEPSGVFVVAASLEDIAEPGQKQQILDTPIVKQALERAKTEAAEYEAQGKWFDSYTSCWYWLSVLDKDNEQYKEHADELVEKAGILGSFQDSPCETSRQRFEKVEPSMFEHAIEVIDTTYVNPMFIDYSKMAKKALNRCRLLAEVVRDSFDQIQQSYNDSSDTMEILYRPDSNSVKAWTESLNAIQSDIDEAENGISRERFISIFEQVLILNSMTVALPKTTLIAHFAEAALSVLDPHTVIVWPQQVDDFKKSLMGEFSGIGILISKEKGLLTAASLLPDTPAYKSGLDAGDIIEAVDGVPTKDMSLECAVKHITGAPGTAVKLTVRTPGDDQSRELSIVRAKIVVQTIRGWQRTTSGQWKYMLDEERKIGYVRLTSFSDNTADEFERVLDQLEEQGMRALILDLRFNPGGLLDSAVDVADKFIRKGLIVRTQPRWGIPDYRSATSRTHPDYPLVVLVNQYSASASEIVAGALQDEKYRRAIIVGQRTHGKGSVQQVSYRPGGGAQLKYTIAYYHLPSGQRVESREDMEKLGREDWGITPDVKVKLTGEELSKLTDVERDNDVLVKADHDVDTAPLKKHSLKETLEADPQLNVALLVIRTKLLEQGRAVAAQVPLSDVPQNEDPLN